MRWHPTTETPTRTGDYLVRLDWSIKPLVASWTPSLGWWDGYRRLLRVKRWCEIPLDPEDDDAG